MVKIKFSYITRYGQFTDMLVLPENHGKTKAEIEEIKIKRRDAWVDYMRKVSSRVSSLPTPPIAQESMVAEPVVEEPVVEEPAPEEPTGE